MVHERKKNQVVVPQKRIHAFLTQHTTNSEKETLGLAEKFGRNLKTGDVVAFTGPIGSGKTVFIKGLARGLGVKNPDEVKSPTFVLLHLYEGRFPIQHFDLYRFEREEELDEVGFDEFVSNREAVTFVEWAEKAERRIPKNSFWIQLEVTGENSRNIVIVSPAERGRLRALPVPARPCPSGRRAAGERQAGGRQETISGQ